jgi:hypothetical protein
MKALICFATGSVHITTFATKWMDCGCGNARVKWLDPESGTVVVWARKRNKVRLLGLNNHYLIPALTFKDDRDLSWEEYQELHKLAAEAPGYLFDKEKVGCWAAVVKIGRSNDV